MTDEVREPSTSDIAAAADRREDEMIERDRVVEVAAHEPEIAAPLFPDEELSGYRTRWSAIQTGFVDEPRKAVEEADALVAELMKKLADVFSHERGQLEANWDRTDQVSTEDLRIAMRRYRSFFERLLNV